MHHPWRTFRNLVDWTLHWADLPEGLLGYTNFATKTVVLTTGMTQAERRCTIAHETEHIRRGLAGGCGGAEEIAIDRNVARQLLPDFEKVVDAMAWHHFNVELAAEELWVDVPILEMRLACLHPTETHLLRRRRLELEGSIERV